jgi:hypothetical protein
VGLCCADSQLSASWRHPLLGLQALTGVSIQTLGANVLVLLHIEWILFHFFGLNIKVTDFILLSLRFRDLIGI